MQSVILRVDVHRPHALGEGEPSVNTLLVTPVISGDADPERTGAAVVLLIDTSGSMGADGKLDNARAAAAAFIGRLRASDQLAIVGFDEQARVVVPLSGFDRGAAMSEAIGRLQAAGGTRIGEALRVALEQLTSATQGRTRRVILLTDGETQDSARCLEQAALARAAGVPVSAYGLGSTWNSALLTEIAEAAAGHVGYIASPADVVSTLAGEFRDVMDTALVDAELVVTPADGVTVLSVSRIIPDVLEYPTSGSPEVTADVGQISRDSETGSRFLVDLRLPPRPAGPVRVARLQLRYREPGSADQRSTDSIGAVVTYTLDRNEAARVDPVIQGFIAQRQASRLVSRADEAMRRGDVDRATQLLSNARVVTQRLGQDQRTTELTSTLEELARTGQISEELRKTIIFGTRQTTRLSD